MTSIIDRYDGTGSVVKVSDLRVRVDADESIRVDGVSFELGPGQVLGIVGESGSGKSVTLRAALGLLPHGMSKVGGRIELFGVDVEGLSAAQWVDVRGGGITAVFQDPGSYLNPAITVGKQVAEVLRVKRGLGRREARTEALRLLDEVRISNPELVYKQYPHELSGGMLQRVTLAIAVSLEPRVLIADEATTALDVTVQAEVLDLITELTRRYGLSLIFVSHDLAVVAQVADQVLVFRDGKIVDRGPTIEVLRNPQHDYTRLLVAEHQRFGIDRYLTGSSLHESVLTEGAR